jgi:hypothetical protein
MTEPFDAKARIAEVIARQREGMAQAEEIERLKRIVAAGQGQYQELRRRYDETVQRLIEVDAELQQYRRRDG